MMNSTRIPMVLGSPAGKHMISPPGSLSSACSTTVGDNSPTNSQDTPSSYANTSSYSKTSSSSLMGAAETNVLTQQYPAIGSSVSTSYSPVSKTYGPVRKLPAAACIAVSSPLGMATRGGLRPNDHAELARTLPFKQPNFALRSKYSHSENAMIFLIMAAKLIEPEGPPLHQAQPFFVFRREASDPLIKSQVQPFADRVANAMRCKYPCYVLALIYLEKLKLKHPQKLSINHTTFQRLLVASIVVAAKFYDDLYYSNEHYAKELGFPLETVNNLEVCFLVLQDFDLRVGASEFQKSQRTFDATRKQLLKNKAWCGLNNAEVDSDLNSVLPRGSNFTCSSPDDLRCSAALFVHATAAGGIRHHSPSPAPIKQHLDRLVDEYLVSREFNGWRYESEEEFLYKAGVQSRSKVINTLLQQYNEELRILHNRPLGTAEPHKSNPPSTATTTANTTSTKRDFTLPQSITRPQLWTRRS